MTKEDINKFCFDDQGKLKPKPECRAGLINHLILEDMTDIDEAENYIDKTLRELNLWGEPRLEDLLRDDDVAV